MSIIDFSETQTSFHDNDGNALTCISPLVSVILTSYNYARFIGEAIDSVISQHTQDLELIVIDDGSVDGSVELIREYAQKYPPLRLLQHADGLNHGLPATLFLGVKQARGDYVAFLESDDAWTPDCLTKRLACLEDTGADIVFNHLDIIDMRHSCLSGNFTMAEATRKRFTDCKEPFSLLEPLLIQNHIPTFSCIMLKRKLFEGISFNSPVPRWLDWWLWLQLAEKFSFIYLDVPCTRWRMHDDSYNRKVDFRAYLHDTRVMWNGFKKKIMRGRYQISIKYKLLLKLPFIFPLSFRFLRLLCQCGVMQTFKRMASKYNWSRN